MFQPVAWRFCAAALVIGISAPSPTAQSRIEEARFARIGGIDQWVTIRGDNRANPVVLVLHGGPGDAQSSLVATYAPLDRDFVVVQWDQRGAGKTLARAGGLQTTSLHLLIDDGIELTRYIGEHLTANSIVLVGHSWGSFLAVHLVKRAPELFRAFVGTGQVVAWQGMVEAQYRYTLGRARAESNTVAVTELEATGIPAPDNFDQYLVMRRRLNGYLAPPDMQWLSTQDALVRAALSPDDFMAYRQGFQTMTGLASAVFSMDLPALGFEFKVPFFVIQGSDDHLTPAPLVAGYFEKITAPVKRMTLIDGAGHFAAMTHMQQFVSALREDMRLLPQ